MTENLPNYPVLADFYPQLIEDCKVLIIEHTYRSKLEIIECYHSLGNRILQDNHNFERAKIYGDKIVERLATDLSVSEKTIRRSINFAKAYPKLNDVISNANKQDGKTISWNKICKQLESGSTEQKADEEWVTCTNCKGKGRVKKEV
jgi:hypothetical protein